MDEGARPLDDLLREADEATERLSPAEAFVAVRAGALIIDIRSDNARVTDGIVPGAIHVPRTVLEWRLEPGGAWRNPHVGGVGRQVIVLCDHGYASRLAAATLARLGYERACDVIGGFEAWRAAGLPTALLVRPRGTDELPGMEGPD